MTFQPVNTRTMNDLILRHLRQHGNISPLEAEGMFRCRSLSRRICDLKEAGHRIEAVWKKDTTGQRYRRYVLVEEVAVKRRRPSAYIIRQYAWE